MPAARTIITRNESQGDPLSLDGKLCSTCNTRPATCWWTDGGALALVHGMATPICERCALEAQLAHAREMATKIPELEARLAALP